MGSFYLTRSFSLFPPSLFPFLSIPPYTPFLCSLPLTKIGSCLSCAQFDGSKKGRKS